MTMLATADPALRNRLQAGSEFLRAATVKPSTYRDAVTATEVYAGRRGRRSSACTVQAMSMRNLEAGRVESRDLTVASGAGGAHAVPQAFLARLVKSLLNNSSVRGLATVIDTDDGRTTKFPAMDDTAQLATILGHVTVGHASDPTLTQASLGAWNYVAPAILASRGLVEDSAFDVIALPCWAPSAGTASAGLRSRTSSAVTAPLAPQVWRLR